MMRRGRRAALALVACLAVWSPSAQPVPASAQPVLRAAQPVHPAVQGMAVQGMTAPHAAVDGIRTSAAVDDDQGGAKGVPFPDLLPQVFGDPGVDIALTSVSPAVATPDKPVTVRATITNQSAEPLTGAARLRLGGALPTRSDLTRRPDVWATPAVTDDIPVTNLAVGSSVQVSFLIAPDRMAQRSPYGVLPLLVEVAHGDKSTALPSFLPFQSRKEFQPLSLAVAVPLAPDPEPALLGPNSSAESAWAKTTGAGSRLDRILTATRSTQITYAVDPALVSPSDPAPAETGQGGTSGTAGVGSTETAVPGTPTPVTTTTASGTSAPATPLPATPTGSVSAGPTPPVSPARDAFATRLAGLAAAHPLWALPSWDSDLSALVEQGVGGSELARRATFDPRLSSRLGATARPMLWPLTPVTTTQRAAIWSAYAGLSGAARPAALVLPLEDVQDQGLGITGDAARRFGDGTPVLAYDGTLSRVLADASSSSAAGVTQRFLAESMAILQEAPSRSRRLLVVAPREFDPRTDTLTSLLAATGTAPWLSLTSTEQLVTASADPDAPAASSQEPARQDPVFAEGPSPLTLERLRQVDADHRRIDAIASILPSSSAAPAGAQRAVQGLLSTSWRGADRVWQRAQDSVRSGIDPLVQGVSVAPTSQWNFFADSGTLQVTVANQLDVDVHDVQLRLVVDGRSQRLRVPTEPFVISVAARSRAVVRVPAEAVAAGPVTLSAHLTAADGTRLGAQDTALQIQVQPTNGWVILALGGLAGAVFLVGLLRTIRRNRPRVSAEDLKEIDFS